MKEQKASGWKKAMAQLVVEEDDSKGKKGKPPKIINEASGLEDFVIVYGSKDGDEFKRLTHHATTAEEQLAAINKAYESGKTGFNFYKLVPDARAEKAAQEKSDKSKENRTMKKEKTEKIEKSSKKSSSSSKSSSSKKHDSSETAKRKHVKRERVSDEKLLSFIKKGLANEKKYHGRDDKFNPQLLMNDLRAHGLASGWNRFLGLVAKARKGKK